MGKLTKFSKPKNYFLICIIMSLAIIIMSVIGYVLFDINAKITADENINYFTGQSFDLIEERFALIKKMMVEVSSDELITDYLLLDSANSDVMKRAGVIAEIAKYKTDEQNVRQIFICNTERDFVISDAGYSNDIHTFLRYNLEVRETKMDDLYQSLFDINDICVMRYDRIYKNGSFLVLAPMYNQELKRICVVGVVIEERFFENILDRIKIDNQCVLMIASEQGEIISANDEKLLRESVFSGINRKQIYWNSVQYRVFFDKSEKYGVIYYNLVPKNKTDGDFAIIRAVLIVLIAVSGILFIGLWLLFSKRNYKILNAVINGMRKINTDIEGEEIGYIDSAIENLYTESERINKLIKDNSYILKDAMAHRIINGIDHAEADISNVMDYLGLGIKEGQKQAVAFLFDTKYIDATHALLNEAYESFPDKVIAARENNMVIVVFIGDSYNKEYIDALIKNRTEQISKVGIGRSYLSPDEISKSSLEAKEALQYISAESQNKIIEYKQVVACIDYSRGIGWDYNPFVNLLMTGKAFEAVELLRKYIENEFINRKYIKEVYLVSILIDMAYFIKNSLNIAEDITKYDERELSKLSFYEMNMLMEKYFLNVSELFDENGEQGSYNRVVEYILAKDSFEFDLNQIAMDLGVNPSYLSRRFKQKTGENYTDYIRRLKIKETKRLLTETDLSLNEIASLVNYSSGNSLIKVFKREVGITPAIYRERERRKK